MQRLRFFGRDVGRIIGCVGSVDGRKDPQTFLAIARQIIKAYDDVCFVWVGSGGLLSQMIAAVKLEGLQDRVCFFGAVPVADMPKIYQSFDLFLLTSRAEGVPLCVLEANAARVGVVSSGYPGVRSVVVDGVTGLIFDAGDISDGVSKLRSLLDNREQVSSLADAAHSEFDMWHNGPAIMGQDWAGVYRSIVAARE